MISKYRKSKNNYWVKHLCNSFGLNSDGDRYVNPVRNSCASMFAFDALEELGKNQWHDIEMVIPHTKKIMESVEYEDYLSCWDAFVINSYNEGEIDRINRIILNLQNRFGKRLQPMGCRVDIQVKDGTTYLRLNTKSAVKSPEEPIIESEQKHSILFSMFNYIKSLIAVMKWF